jgi:hypothetical protein
MATANIGSNRPGAPQSGFVTALAWIFIVLAGFATLIAILQNIMISLVFPIEEMSAAMRQAEKDQSMPWLARFMLGHIRLFFALFLGLAALTLVAAIGLLKRRNWARIVFIGIMGFGILWNLAGLAMPFLMFSSFAPAPDNAPVEFRDHFEIVAKIMIGFSVVIAIAFSVLFAWIIKRLMAAEVRREFSRIQARS